MGKLRDILCVAANKESLFVAGYYGDRETGDLVLVKSDPYPASLASAKWELLTTKAVKDVNLTFSVMVDDVRCAAGDDGSFLLLFSTFDFHTLFYDHSAPNKWSVSKSGTHLCPRNDFWCSGLLLQVPGTSPSQFKFAYRKGIWRSGVNSTVNFMTFNRSSDMFDLDAHTLTLEDSTQQLQVAYYKNQMLFLNSPLSPINVVPKTSSSVHAIDVDPEYLPIQDRKASNVSFPSKGQCDDSSYFPHNGVGNDGRWYLFCYLNSAYPKNSIYAFDGQAIAMVGSYRPVNRAGDYRRAYSMIPVPSQEAPTWAAVHSKHGETWEESGLFGLGIGGFNLWESSEAAGLLVDGLGLGGGAIAGIVIGALSGVACVVGGYFLYRARVKRRKIVSQNIELEGTMRPQSKI